MVGLGDHVDELAKNRVILAIEFLCFAGFQVATAKSELEPDSGFLGLALRITVFAHKVSFISSFPPRFRNAGTD